MLKTKFKKINVYIILLCVINFFQALFTPLIQDEAYYWTFSKQIAFGYFDHPPMVAYLIKLSSGIFSGPLAVRFATVVLFGFTLKLIWNLVPEKFKKIKQSELLFSLLIMANPLLNVYGFITTPDVPYLFFSVLFLTSVLKFKKKNSIVNAILLSLSASLLIYSKYHGFIVILVVGLFNLKLLYKKSTYISIVLFLIFLIPHFYWQYSNDFITFQYHLFERGGKPFTPTNILEYLGSFIAVINPALLVLLYLSINKKEKKERFNNFYFKIFFSFFLFFLLYSLKSRIEAHWVLFCCIPLVILLLDSVTTSRKKQKQLKIVSITTFAIICIARIIIILDIPIKTEFHKQRKQYFSKIDSLSKKQPVVIENSYQLASKYWFYTNKLTYSENNITSRRNQFNIWSLEEKFQNKDVLFVCKGYLPKHFHFYGKKPLYNYNELNLANKENIKYKKIPSFQVYNKVKAEIINEDIDSLNRKGALKLKLFNPYKHSLDFSNKSHLFEISICLTKENNKYIYPLNIKNKAFLMGNSYQEFSVNYNLLDLPSTTYSVSILMTANGLMPKLISDDNYAKIFIKN